MGRGRGGRRGGGKVKEVVKEEVEEDVEDEEEEASTMTNSTEENGKLLSLKLLLQLQENFTIFNTNCIYTEIKEILLHTAY